MMDRVASLVLVRKLWPWLVLSIAGGLSALIAFRFGLDHTPDSGLYLYSGARAYYGDALSSTQSNYAPGFPWLIALCMTLLGRPGDAGTLVQALSLLAVLFGSYLALCGVGARRPFAVSGALMVAFLSTTTYVFSFQHTEGPLCAAYVLLVVLWSHWRARGGWARTLALLGLAAFTPFLKYASGFVPPLVAVFWAFFLPTTRLRRALAFAGSALLCTLPIGAYFVWNKLREGVLTSHPPSSTPLLDNIGNALSTLYDTWLGWPLPFVLAALALCVLRLVRPRAGLGLPVTGDVAFSAALALGYFAAVIAGATLVHVDVLTGRLCAPGIALLTLTLALGAAAASAPLSDSQVRWQRAIQPALALLAVLAAWPDLGRGVLATVVSPARARKLARVETASERGFRASKSASGLRRFYERSLSERTDVSYTLVEARKRLGRVRRSWIMVAGVLANTPRRLTELGKLELVSVDPLSALYRAGDGRYALHFLNADLPERRGIFDVPDDDPQVRALVEDFLGHVAEYARAAGRREHWLLLPRQARWFQPQSIALPGTSIVREEDAGGYRAYLLQLQPSQQASK